MNEALLEIAKQTPLTLVLVYFIMYLKGELKEERNHNKELNIVIREQQKELIDAVNANTKATEEQNRLNKAIHGKD